MLCWPFAIRRIFETKWGATALYAGALELAYGGYLVAAFAGVGLLAVLLS